MGELLDFFWLVPVTILSMDMKLKSLRHDLLVFDFKGYLQGLKWYQGKVHLNTDCRVFCIQKTTCAKAFRHDNFLNVEW